MEFWLWAGIGCLCAIVIGLLIKIYLLRKTTAEIEQNFFRCLETDTNTLISISSQDSAMKRFAARLNEALAGLREMRHRYQRGDLELKEAVTNISHDLRTPLTAICGYLEILEEEEKTEAADRYISQIKNRTDVMKQLTEELFCYSVVSSVAGSKPEQLNLASVLEESILSFYGAMQTRGIEPQIDITEEVVLRNLDKTAMGRIFSNVISNAIKYSDGDFSVTMNAGGTIIFSNNAEDMGPVACARLFDRFYTVENARSSTGLGLSIAKLLTERMGGTIRAEYERGRLYIIVSFPADAEGRPKY